MSMLDGRERFTNIDALNESLENRVVVLFGKLHNMLESGKITNAYYENTQLALCELHTNEILITYFETYILPEGN